VPHTRKQRRTAPGPPRTHAVISYRAPRAGRHLGKGTHPPARSVCPPSQCTPKRLLAKSQQRPLETPAPARFESCACTSTPRTTTNTYAHTHHAHIHKSPNGVSRGSKGTHVDVTNSFTRAVAARWPRVLTPRQSSTIRRMLRIKGSAVGPPGAAMGGRVVCGR
jgi:hypothetical protein